MAYEWQTSITSGKLIKDEFYYSIQDTYTEVINNHCASNHTGYKASVYSNKSDNSSYTNCSTNDTYYSSKKGTYTCASDKSSNYSSNLRTNKSSNYRTNKSGNYGSDTADSDK